MQIISTPYIEHLQWHTNIGVGKMINHRLNNAFFPLFLFLSKSATINFKTPNIFYVFRCNTTAINNIYKVYCEPHHGMGMLKVPEEATKECFGEIDIQTGAEVKIRGVIRISIQPRQKYKILTGRKNCFL